MVYRLLEVNLDKHGFHVTTDNLITTLENMNVADIHDIEYMVLYDGSQALDALTEMALFPLNRSHYRPKELNSMIKNFWGKPHI